MPKMVPQIKLSNGKEMPVIGLGTYARKAEPGVYRQAVECGIDIGYRHIDTASFYGNEIEVGEGINKKIKEGIITRDELFITTKLWNDCHAEDDVVPELKKSLARLNLNYVDLYLIHWPVSVNSNNEDAGIDYLETWRGMEQALKLGLTKSIGVSNFNGTQLERLIDAANIKPVVNQIEVNPTLTQHELVNICKKLSVLPVAFTPLGLLSEARPEFKGIDAIKTDPKLDVIVKNHNRTQAQIALRYLIQRGIPVIPKSFTKSRMEENLKIFDFQLTKDEMMIMDSFNINHRCVPASALKTFKDYPF